MRKKAKELKDVVRIFTAKPLDASNFEDYYVPCDEARGVYHLDRLTGHLLENKDERTKVAMIGHKACGKSTELYKLSQDPEISSNFWICTFSAFLELGSKDINIVSLLILMMEQLYNQALSQGIKLNPALIQSIYEWTYDITFEKEEKMDLGTASETEIKAGINIPFLKLLGQIKNYFKYNVESKKKSFQKIENRIDDLLRRCDLLIKQIRAELSEQHILLIIEDIDKFRTPVIKSMFDTSTRVLMEISANIIYTLPIPLMYASGGPALANEFSLVYNLNMIKIRHKDNTPMEEGIKKMRQIILQRMEPDLITPEAMDYAIRLSGGVLRHLFTIIVEAGYLAKRNQGDDADKINKPNVLSAAYKIANDFKRSMLDKSEEKRNILKQVEETKDISEMTTDDSSIPLDLMQDWLIVEYQNDEIWQEPHPIYRELF